FRLMGCRLQSGRRLQPRADLAKLFVRKIRAEPLQLAHEMFIDAPLLFERQQLGRIRLAALAYHRSCRGLPWDHLPRAKLVVDALHVGERSLLAYAIDHLVAGADAHEISDSSHGVAQVALHRVERNDQDVLPMSLRPVARSVHRPRGPDAHARREENLEPGL